MRRPLFAFAAMLAACNAISGLDEDFVLAPRDGGASGDLDATTEDGSATNDGAASDVSTNDASTDASSIDAFTCDAANVVFCTDFETDAAWTDNEIVSGAVSFELDAGIGGSRAMHAHVDSANVSRRAALWKKITGTDAKTYKHYDVAFDFNVAGKSFPYAALGVFALTQPSGGGGLRFYGPAAYVDKTIDVVDTFPAGTTHVDDVYGTWHHAFIALEREASGTYAVSLNVDGTVVDTRTGFDFGTPQTAELRIGILFTSTDPGTMDLYIDNVLVRVQ